MPNCSIYSQIVPNYCEECSAGYNKYNITTKCTTVANAITNCDKVSLDGLTCEKCKTNYYMNSLNKCSL